MLAQNQAMQIGIGRKMCSNTVKMAVMKKLVSQIIIVSISILILLTACSKNNAPSLLGEEVQIPNSNFKIGILADYRASIVVDGIYVQPSPPNNSPTFLIWGQTFNVYEPKELWLDQRFADLEQNELEDITINGFSGYVAFDKAENENSEFAGAWVAALTTEDEGLVIYAYSLPDQVQEIRLLLFAMLESVSIAHGE